ncbi:MAG: ABC transporter substrate-binding protein [Deltaproteobacteria bacterium]|nr:ABC transporter substrate-binding protein [Deltaproteobacteria bacterium]
MSKHKLCIIPILIIALVFAVSGMASAQAAKEVVIGFLLPLSGGSATIGKQTQTGALVAADQINKLGGVASMGGAKIKLVFGDSQTKPDVGVSEAERLIQREKVSVICGAYNSSVTFPASEVGERYKTPWVVTGSVKDEITERGFKYVFRPNNKAVYDAKEQMAAIKLFEKETGKGPKTIGHLYEGTDWGRSHAANIRKLCKEMGYKLILDEAYPPGQVDFSSQLLKIRAKKPELMIVALYTPDHIIFSKQYLENRINILFGIHSVGAGSEDPAFYETVPQVAVEYMFVQEDWQVDQLEVMGWAHMANKMFKEKLGYNINAYGAQGYSNVWVIYDALERAGSTDKEKIRKALASTNITSGPALITGYQKISFDENGQNVDAHGVISQNQGGKRISLWPLANRPSGAKVIWPIPSWDKR